MSNIVNHKVQVITVWPGAIGGAIFKANIIGTGKVITCKVSYAVIDRPPQSGEFYIVAGAFFNHSEYGQQLKVSSCRLTHLPSEHYLSSLLTKHPNFRGFSFGKAKVAKLISAIGADQLVSILNDGNSLHLADVINQDIAERLVKNWLKLKNEVNTIQFLIDNNFDTLLSKKIVSLCKSNTVERLKTNPYALVCFHGISRNIWKTIELCAQKLSISLSDPRRLIGAIEYLLYKRLKQGHTAILEDDLMLLAVKLLNSHELAEKAIQESLKAKAVCFSMQNGDRLLQPIGPAYIEYSIEKRLTALQTGTMQQSLFHGGKDQSDIISSRYFNEFHREHGFTLTAQQTEAVIRSLSSRLSIISGFGGTGKTTVLRAVTELASSMNRVVYLTALAGKAKERMAEATGHSAYTLHAFIQASSNGKIDIACDPLIVIDEASMVDIALFNKLLGLFDGVSFSLILVGDTAQLAPIGFGVVWHKLVTSTKIRASHLTEVRRQSEDSPIPIAAMNVREAQLHTLPEWSGESSGMYLVSTISENLLYTLAELKNRFPDAQILTPHMSRKMNDSGHIINEHLQSQKHSLDSKHIKLGATRLYEGDPVIVTENSYELGLFNGTTGILSEITTSPLGQVTGVFDFKNDDGPRALTADEMFDVGIQLAYAISVHKAQGSEYDAAIICCTNNSLFVERSLIYTAITRCKKLCLVVGSPNVYNDAIARTSRADDLCVGINL